MMMVKAVARAIENVPVSWSIRLVRMNESGEVYRLTMDDKTISEGKWREDLEQQVQHLVAEKQARAAIAAMKQPTQAMCAAAADATAGAPNEIYADDALNAWYVMIDAALAEHDAGA